MRTLHIVPHTHWDREWYLPFQEMRIKLVHLVDGLLELLESDEAFSHFTLDGQTSLLDDYLEIRPEQAPRLRELIRAGRLLVGPWRVLPDEFLVSPEALIRNLAFGRRDAEALAGVGRGMDVGYVPDPFGHVGQLPQILRGFGIEFAAFRRGLGPEPAELWWDAPDGSRVLVAYLRDGYDNAARLPLHPKRLADHLLGLADALDPHSSVSQRLLLNGTDHHEAQRGLARSLTAAELGEDRALISTLPRFMQGLQAEVLRSEIDLPVVRGELRDPSRHHLLPGVLSSRTWIKQRNDRCETELECFAEPLTLWAELYGGADGDAHVFTGHLETPRVREPQPLLDHAWRLLLDCHPHDSICGCSVDAVHEEMRPRLDGCEQIGRELTRQGLAAIAGAVRTADLARHGARQAVVVFNPSTWTGAQRVACEVELSPELDAFEVVDLAGHTIPCRELAREQRELADLELDAATARGLAEALADGRVESMAIQAVRVDASDPARPRVELTVSETGDPDLDAVGRGLREVRDALDAGARRLHARVVFAARVRFELAAAALPSHGWTSFGLRPAAAPVLDRDDETTLRNEALEVSADGDGTLRLRDRRSGREWSGLAALCDRGERGDSYTTDPLDDEVASPLRDVRIERVREADGGFQTLRITGTLAVPAGLAPERDRRSDVSVELPVELEATLCGEAARVDLRLRVDNRARDHRLEWLFPGREPVAEAEYGGHFERIRRPTRVASEGDGIEQPRPERPVRGHVRAGDLRVAVRGLREARVDGDGTIAWTLLRCFSHLSRSDLRTRRGGAGPEIETPGGQSPGPHVFEAAVFAGADEHALGAQEADAFRAPPRGRGTPLRDGDQPPARTLVAVEPAGFELTSVSATRGGDAIVRGVWHGDQETDLRIGFDHGAASAERIRLDETRIGSLPLDPDDGVRLRARPREVVSVRFAWEAES